MLSKKEQQRLQDMSDRAIKWMRRENKGALQKVNGYDVLYAVMANFYAEKEAEEYGKENN